MLIYCNLSSISVNSIYSIHKSYHSLSLSINTYNIILIIWLTFWFNYLPLLTVFLLLLVWLYIFNWLNDLYIESFLSTTVREQLSLIYGIKLLIISELMLFVACFWCLINFRFISNSYSLFFSFPLLSSYSFSIPFSNLCILLFSSLPLQSAQIFIKIGFLNNTIESIGQSLSCGLLSIILQLKEFLYSYLSLSDCLIGSIFYFTTGLHGFHVIIGTLLFFLILFFISIDNITTSVNTASNYRHINSLFFMEYSFPLFLSSYYWHFVDWIWFCVFLIFVVLIVDYSLVIIRFNSYSSLV